LFTSDNISKMKARYLAEGAAPERGQVVKRATAPDVLTAVAAKNNGSHSDDIFLSEMEAFANLRFIIYHSCIAPVLFYNPEPLNNLLSRRPTLRHGVPDIRWTTRFAQIGQDHSNVYAEVGSTFASTVITFPTVWAHIIGQLTKYMGSKRVMFGSDSLWYGSPQWQYEAFWRFQIPDKIADKWGYPHLDAEDKRNILGLNSARLYHVASTNPHRFGQVPSDFEQRMPSALKALLEFPGFASDNFSKMKARYLAEGAAPDHTRYGWIRTI